MHAEERGEADHAAAIIVLCPRLGREMPSWDGASEKEKRRAPRYRKGSGDVVTQRKERDLGYTGEQGMTALQKTVHKGLPSDGSLFLRPFKSDFQIRHQEPRYENTPASACNFLQYKRH